MSYTVSVVVAGSVEDLYYCVDDIELGELLLNKLRLSDVVNVWDTNCHGWLNIDDMSRACDAYIEWRDGIHQKVPWIKEGF